jgi:hypothetical protein
MKAMLTRRNALLGLGLATAGCAGEFGGSGLPPGIQTGNVAPDDNLVLGPDENILVGMVAQVIRSNRVPTAGAPLNDASLYVGARASLDRPRFLGPPRPYLIVEASTNRQFGIPFPGLQTDLISITQDGEQVQYRPFAMRVPKGPYKFVGRMTLNTQHGWYWTRISPLEFNVRPGSVAYIGRFGQISQIIQYSEAAFERQTQGLEVLRARPRGDFRGFLAKAPAGSSSDLPRSCSGPFGNEAPACLFEEFFVLNNADQDLPLLRQRFPRLANAQIITAAPTPVGVDGWKRWPDVLRPLSVS